MFVLWSVLLYNITTRLLAQLWLEDTLWYVTQRVFSRNLHTRKELLSIQENNHSKTTSVHQPCKSD